MIKHCAGLIIYNVNYITRQKNINAKAGNINNALQYIEGELFAVLDADMICKKDFLKHTVGYFIDENLVLTDFLLFLTTKW